LAAAWAWRSASRRAAAICFLTASRTSGGTSAAEIGLSPRGKPMAILARLTGLAATPRSLTEARG
jgi:hypothetical protein